MVVNNTDVYMLDIMSKELPSLGFISWTLCGHASTYSESMVKPQECKLGLKLFYILFLLCRHVKGNMHRVDVAVMSQQVIDHV